MDSLRTLVEWHGKGWIRPHISHRLPFDRAPQALQLLRDRQATGKVVVEI
jgi:NADPH2:quinone reductase